MIYLKEPAIKNYGRPQVTKEIKFRTPSEFYIFSVNDAITFQKAKL